MLQTIRQAPGGVPGDLTQTVNNLQAWVDSGAHRRDHNHVGVYDDAASGAGDGRLVAARPRRRLQAEARRRPLQRDQGKIGFDDQPRDQGSAYQEGWYGYMQKDLRDLLGVPVQGPYSRVYCGGGDLATCAAALVSCCARRARGAGLFSLLREPQLPRRRNADDPVELPDVQRRRQIPDRRRSVDQPMHWINRPTYQQAVEVQGHRPRPPEAGGATSPQTGGGTHVGRCAKARKGKKKHRRCVCRHRKHHKKQKKCRRHRRHRVRR